jgi:DNA-binding NtrC family response regulator
MGTERYILVVEEVEALQGALLRTLRRRGVTAHAVSRCHDAAVAMSSDHRPCALLVSCPGVDRCPRRAGDPFYAALAEVPVVAMTWGPAPVDCHCICARLAKPFDPGRLVDLVLDACAAACPKRAAGDAL